MEIGGSCVDCGGVLGRVIEVANGPLRWGNWSGLERPCVRSKRPHLLQSYYRSCQRGAICGTIENEKQTTLPGLRFDRLHVEVSVVQQLKHLRRTLSLSLVAASSV